MFTSDQDNNFLDSGNNVNISQNILNNLFIISLLNLKKMNKCIWYNLTIALILVVNLTSCNNNEPKQEVFKFPIELSPVEISNISNSRFFIGGKEVFDTTLCKSFMRSEWIKMSNGSQRYYYFDKDNFMKDGIPQNITFIAQDTALIDYSHFIVEWKKSFFAFSPSDNQSLTYKTYDFRDYLNLKQTAYGNYTELEYNIVNYRYHRNVKNTPLWEDNNDGIRDFGMAGRIKGEIEYNTIVNTMLPTDTFVFQQYKVRYKTLKQN